MVVLGKAVEYRLFLRVVPVFDLDVALTYNRATHANNVVVLTFVYLRIVLAYGHVRIQ